MHATDAIAFAEFSLGFELRDYQRAAVEALVSGSDVMMSAPTGSGKTAVYQAACWGLRERGVTVVLSPLIALIRDQHRRMEEAGIESACFFSQVPQSERRFNADMVEAGDVDLVLTTPESLGLSARLRDALGVTGVALLVVDEGHAYEEWAHSFRPAYRRVGRAVDEVGAERMLVCSATLSPLAAAEAAESLGRWHWEVVAAPAERPNLSYESAWMHGSAGVLARLGRGNGSMLAPPGIVYTTAARSAEYLADEAEHRRLPHALYHGRLGKRERNAAQREWMDGSLWLFGTKAFGMGVDKADVRTVVHAELPASVIDYAQEAGRAGRDGLPARCVLNSADDGRVAAFLVNQSNPSLDRVRCVYDATLELCGEMGRWAQVPSSRVATATGLRQGTVQAARGWLAGAGAIDVRPGDRKWGLVFDDDGEAGLAATAQGRRLRGAVACLRRCGRVVEGVRRATPEEIGDALSALYKDWRRAVGLLEAEGALRVDRPARSSWVRVRRPWARFDPERLERARAHALRKLEGMREFARLPDGMRAESIERTIELDAEEALEEIKWRREK